MTSFLILLCLQASQASTASGPDFMQSIGKIYVVVAVIVIIFLGLVLYLYRLDRRISRIEKRKRYEK
ncbi:MAG: CcmD family protein [Saprospiraceae bacterium]|nr:CcmD family protein [Saprospiraceae bacterium]